MPDDHRVVIAGGDAGTELLAVGWLKILFRRHQDMRAGIEAEEIRAPLLRQVIGHDVEVLLGKPQTPAFHARGDHGKGLARADAMGQQRVAAVQDVRHSVFLMGHEGDGRRHADESNVTAVVFAGPDGVEQAVVFCAERLPPGQVFENPFLERFADHVLFLLGQNGLLLVQHAVLSVRVPHDVVNLCVFQIQRVLQQLVAVDTIRAVGAVGHGIAGITAFARDVPHTADVRVLGLNGIAGLPTGRVKDLAHEIVEIVRLNPGCAESHFNFGGIQVLGLHALEILYIHGKSIVASHGVLGQIELPAHIAGQVLVVGLPPSRLGVSEDDALQFRNDLFLRL